MKTKLLCLYFCGSETTIVIPAENADAQAKALHKVMVEAHEGHTSVYKIDDKLEFHGRALLAWRIAEPNPDRWERHTEMLRTVLREERRAGGDEWKGDQE